MAAAVGVGVASVPTAAAASAVPDDQTVTVEVFRETIKPWDSIKIPNLSCPVEDGYLKDEILSPGRLVPHGLQVVEPGSVGVTVTGLRSYWTEYPEGRWVRPVKGTLSSVGTSSATNWDPFSSHELVINLRCTSDMTKVYMHPDY